MFKTFQSLVALDNYCWLVTNYCDKPAIIINGLFNRKVTNKSWVVYLYDRRISGNVAPSVGPLRINSRPLNVRLPSYAAHDRFFFCQLCCPWFCFIDDVISVLCILNIQQHNFRHVFVCGHEPRPFAVTHRRQTSIHASCGDRPFRIRKSEQWHSNKLINQIFTIRTPPLYSDLSYFFRFIYRLLTCAKTYTYVCTYVCLHVKFSPMKDFRV